MFTLALALALSLAVAALPAPAQQAPQRVYQPKVFEPGLDGGKNGHFARGEFTPDGRVLIAFRQLEDSTVMPPVMRYALTASLTHPDRLVDDGAHLESFYTELASPTSQQYGTSFTFGDATESPSEWVRIHWGHEVIPCAPFSGDCIQPCGLVQNPAYPGSDTFGAAHMSVTLREPSGNAVSNPFPSDEYGTYSANGDHTTYDLWIVRTHWSQPLTCSTESTGLVQWNSVTPGTDTTPVLAAQNVRIVIDEMAQTITSAEVLMSGNDYFEPLVVAATGSNIRGIEPTLTADGRLLLYHGAGNLAMASAGHAVVTYSYNSTGSIATGWSEPRSITELPSSIELNGLSPQDFKDRYRLFQKLPTMTNNTGGGTFQFAMGDNVPGTYPWVSKDGSFYNAYSVRATEAFETQSGAQVSSNKIKVGAYVMGDLTNWTIKHIDSAALNPTRLGGPWLWPRHLTSPINSWGAMTMSAGVKPGRWQPLIEQGGTHFPTMPASQRIPILPLFLPVIDTYGEVRFEGADGNYLLYLACNEAFDIHTAPSPTVTSKPFKLLPKSTPDSSGRDTSALCELNIGAAFPQEAYTNAGSTATALRQAIGGELFELPVAFFHPFHENVGFKGQAIVFNPEGAIDVTELERLGNASEWTVQCFAKFVRNVFVVGATTTSLFEYGVNFDSLKIPGIILDVDAQGVVHGRVRVALGTDLAHVETTRTLTNGAALEDRTEGWHHIALTYTTDAVIDETRIAIYFDGALEDELVLPVAIDMPDLPTYPAYATVGPGTGGPATTAVTFNNDLLVLDEVALSNVARTEEEIRRDAFVTPLPSAFTQWPANAPALPVGLKPEDAKWPAGLAYDPAVHALGNALFADTLLSDPGVGRSCATCHIDTQEKLLTDSPNQFAKAIDTTDLPFNTPSLFNAAFGTVKTFEGHAASIEEQIKIPLENPLEMGNDDIDDVVARVNANTAYLAAFNTYLGGPATPETLSTALAMSIRARLLANAPFDMNPNAIAVASGRELFFGKARCFTCHTGSNFSDDGFHNVRTVPTVNTGNIVQGLVASTGRPADLGKIKTPSLRNLKKTGPYFHNGMANTLKDVVEHYNDPFNKSAGPIMGDTEGVADRDLYPLDLSSDDIDDVVLFLESLSRP